MSARITTEFINPSRQVRAFEYPPLVRSCTRVHSHEFASYAPYLNRLYSVLKQAIIQKYMKCDCCVRSTVPPIINIILN